MKKLIVSFANWLLKIVNTPQEQETYTYVIKSPEGFCNVIRDSKYLYLTMPDNTIIPVQTKFSMKNNMIEDRGAIEVTITVRIPLKEEEKKKLNERLGL